MLTKTKEMTLYRWFCPVDVVLDPKGPLSHTVPPNVITEVNKEVKNASQTKKRGSYLSFTAKEEVLVAKYGSTNKVRAAVSNELGEYLKESTVRDWVKACPWYRAHQPLTRPANSSAACRIPRNLKSLKLILEASLDLSRIFAPPKVSFYTVVQSEILVECVKPKSLNRTPSGREPCFAQNNAHCKVQGL